jgi:hypothetical protein
MKTILVPEQTTAHDLFLQLRGEPLLLQEQSGRAFVLVEVDRDDVESLALATNSTFDQILERSRGRARREGWMSTEQVRKELGVS